MRSPRVNRGLIILVLFSVIWSSCNQPTGGDDLPEFDVSFAQTGDQLVNRLIAVSDGIILIGTTTVSNTTQAFLWKTDFSGNILWQRDLGLGTEGWSVKLTADNSLVTVGIVNDLSGNQNVMLLKTDLHGNTDWQQQFGGPFSDLGKDVIELQDGSFMIVGTTSSIGSGPASMLVIKTDANGNEIWNRSFGGEGLDGGSELVQVNSYEVMLLGFTGSFGAGDRDVYLQSVSTDGDSLASFFYGGAGYEESQAFQLTSYGSFIMSNHSASNDPTHKLLATKLNTNGQVVWEQEFGTLSEHEGGEGVLADSEGNYIFIGRTNSFGNDEQIYFIKTDEHGNVHQELSFGSEGDQRGTDIIEHDDAYYISGQSTENGDWDVMLIKRRM